MFNSKLIPFSGEKRNKNTGFGIRVALLSGLARPVLLAIASAD